MQQFLVTIRLEIGNLVYRVAADSGDHAIQRVKEFHGTGAENFISTTVVPYVGQPFEDDLDELIGVTKEHLAYILSESVENPVPLTADVLQANGLLPEWLDPCCRLFSYEDEFNIEEVLNEEDERYTYYFKLYNGEKVEIHYEHQLQGLIEAHNQ